MATWIGRALNGSGYTADFSPDSLAEIDRFLDDHASEGQPVKGGLLSESLGPRVFALGSYVGEVVRRELGGVWHGDDDDPHGEANVRVNLDNAATIWPVQRVMKRLQNGDEDGIAAYGAALRAHGHP
jgi:hypothetical protein